MLVAVASVPATAVAATTASPHIRSQPRQQEKIIGGQPDPYNDTGWVGAVIQKGYGQTCTSSLYAWRYVLTAAHCALNDRQTRVLNPWQLKVRLGSKYWDSGGVVRGVNRIYVYPHYNPRSHYGDIAVLKLSSPVYLRTVRLVSSGTSYVTNPPNPAYIAGWGSLNNRDGPYPRRLYSTWVWLLPDRDCQGLPYHYDGSVMICAGAQGRDTCYGDSGGPLAVWDGRWWQLVGVTSYGRYCGEPASAYAWIGSPILHRWLTGS